MLFHSPPLFRSARVFPGAAVGCSRGPATIQPPDDVAVTPAARGSRSEAVTGGVRGYTSSYGPQPTGVRGPKSREFWFWMGEAHHADAPGLELWHAHATGNAIGFATRSEHPARGIAP